MSRLILEVKPQFRPLYVLPLEGKGDRSAVDEVTGGPASLREALCAAMYLSIAFEETIQLLTAAKQPEIAGQNFPGSDTILIRC